MGHLGEYQRAADLHRQHLADTERIFGPDHPDTLSSRHNLAAIRALLAGARRRRWWQLPRRREGA
ncbi:tetratricopeptide repeat protein [Streptomyces sp. 021-4]|uniref:tetratricopeptide repeat protein n=1 Tax=Streptomyces sp. 021-4 TaxID=2789260 RepID=UPI0039F60C96